MRAVGQLILIAVAAVVSWFVLIDWPFDPPHPPVPPDQAPLEIALTPEVETPAGGEPAEALPPPGPSPEPEPEAAPAEKHPQLAGYPEDPAPPPPEAGDPEGAPEPEEPAAPETDPAEEAAKDLARELESIEGSDPIMRRAAEELSGETKKGFSTTFRCSARDQLDIARYFDEPVLLVPRKGLQPGREYYYRLRLAGEAPRIEKFKEAPPLSNYRQYRDLFAFPYESLPGPLRELRRRVFVRGDIFLFAALIPPREWGLVIVRRQAALAEYNRASGGAPKTEEDVRGFTMRYVRLPGGAFDIRVAEIQFADGTRFEVPERR